MAMVAYTHRLKNWAIFYVLSQRVYLTDDKVGDLCGIADINPPVAVEVGDKVAGSFSTTMQATIVTSLLGGATVM